MWPQLAEISGGDGKDMGGAPVSEALERYLEAVYILQHTGGAIAARVAERLGVRPPSATVALRRLEAQGLLRTAADRSLHLTAEGEQLARQVMRRHRVLERWLVEGLGLDWARAHSEAQRMEHAVSAEVVDRLYEAMGRPQACPHGNPIPGLSGLPAYAGTMTLDRAAAGVRLRVARIAEDAEESLENLACFERLGLRPGERLHVLARASGGGPVRFAAGAGEAPAELAADLAAKVWVDEERGAVG